MNTRGAKADEAVVCVEEQDPGLLLGLSGQGESGYVREDGVLIPHPMSTANYLVRWRALVRVLASVRMLRLRSIGEASAELYVDAPEDLEPAPRLDA